MPALDDVRDYCRSFPGSVLVMLFSVNRIFFSRALLLRMQIDRSCWLPNKQGAFNFYYYFHQYLSLTFVGHLTISDRM